jgi:hypothetical protein
MDEESQIEQLLSAHRERSAHGEIRPAPVFYDLGEEARARAFDAAVTQRQLEAALDEDGLSSTARAVLQRIARLG